LSLCWQTAGAAARVVIGDAAFVVRELEIGAGEPAFAFADFNGDGHQDLAVAGGSDHTVTVLLGNGGGNLTASGEFSAGRNPNHLAAADIDRDGLMDLVVANHETTYLTLLIGYGRGGLEQAKNSPFRTDAAPHPHEVAAEDLDDDGYLDLIVDSRDTRGVRVHRGLGQGRFAEPGTSIDAGGPPYLGFAIGDLNGDGWLDLATPNDAEIGILLSSGSGTPSFRAGVPVRSDTPFSVAVADFNRDGNLDLIAASERTGVEIFNGDGTGAFAAATANASFRLAAGAKRIAVGDVDGDGFPDALVGSWSGQAIVILGHAAGYRSTQLPLHGVQNPWGLALVDLNEDGKDDLVVADGVGVRANVYLSFSP
jgi:hypothetical protein